MVNIKKNHFLLFGIIFTFLFSCSAPSEKHKVLKLAHGLDITHPVHKAMVYMAQRCSTLSEGALQVEIYPSAQLGSEQQCVELLQIGSLAITKVSTAVMEGFTDEYKVLGLPYIFRSKEHAFDVLQGKIGKDILASSEEFWIRGLCFYDAGSRSFYTINKAINTPDDLKGMKIRVQQSTVSVSLMKALGASPTPISFGELYTALQSGVVDGAENNAPSLYTSHHYEVCKYYSLTEHTSVPDVLIISLKVWEKLNEQEKSWLQQSADESAIKERELWSESEKESLQAVQDAGVSINYPDKELFAAKVGPVYDLFKNQPKVNNLIQRIKAAE